MHFVNKAMPTSFIDSKCHANELKSCKTSYLWVDFTCVALNSLGVDMHTHMSWIKEISCFVKLK